MSEEISQESQEHNSKDNILHWYAIQTYSGRENSVKKAIESLVEHYKLHDRFGKTLVEYKIITKEAGKEKEEIITKDEIVVLPTEDIIEIKNNKKKILKRVIYSGYVFINVNLDIDLWHKIQTLNGVGRFIGESKKPSALSENDIKLILEKLRNRAAPRPKISFESGEVVRIVEGPFINFTGNVEEFDMEHKKLKLNVSIFGRNTPIEIEYSKVEKIV